MSATALRWSGPAAAFVLALAAWHDSLAAWFANDDFRWLTEPSFTTVIESWIGGWGHGPAFRPLMRLSFWIDRQLFGLDPVGPHLVNLTIHGLNTGMIFILVRQVWNDTPLAALVALLFAWIAGLHENVIWISGRTHLLGAAFCLAALISLGHAVAARSRGWCVAALGAYGAALCTYEASIYLLPLCLARLVQLGSLDDRFARSLMGGCAVLTILWLAYRKAVLPPEPFYELRDWSSVAAWRDLWTVARVLGGALKPHWAAIGLGFLWLVAVRGRRSSQVLLGLGLAVLLYLPFVPFAGLSPRLLYAAYIGVALAAAAVVLGVWETGKVPGKVAAVVATVSALAINFLEVRSVALEWRDAGLVGRAILDRMSDAIRGQSPPRVVAVLGLPWFLGRAPLYVGYFDVAYRLRRPDRRDLIIPGHYGRMAPALVFERRRLHDAAAVRVADCFRPDVTDAGIPRFIDDLAGACDALVIAVEPGDRYLATGPPSMSLRVLPAEEGRAMLRRAFAENPLGW